MRCKSRLNRFIATLKIGRLWTFATTGVLSLRKVLKILLSAFSPRKRLCCCPVKLPTSWLTGYCRHLGQDWGSRWNEQIATMKPKLRICQATVCSRGILKIRWKQELWRVATYTNFQGKGVARARFWVRFRIRLFFRAEFEAAKLWKRRSERAKAAGSMLAAKPFGLRKMCLPSKKAWRKS